MNINSTIGSAGRFANHFFRNIAMHFISQNNNIKFNYSYSEEFDKLGVELFKNGTITYNENMVLNDDNFYNLISENIKINKNIEVSHHMYNQTKDFARYIKKYINENEQKNKIIKHNIFNSRYDNNNDVFIHVRLGDVLQFNPGFIYYDKVLSNLKFNKGYISSDSIHHSICKELINKYNLTIFNGNEVNTIMFASTCKNIVLSHGTFSWLIGLFGFYSNIYYPKITHIWHGDIFVFPEWNEIL